MNQKKLIKNYVEVLQAFTGNWDAFFFQTVITESLDCDQSRIRILTVRGLTNLRTLILFSGNVMEDNTS